MFSSTAPSRYMPGPLAEWVRGDMSPMQHEMARYAQRGRESLMHGASDVERFMEENAAMLCVGGLLLGTFLDKRFYLLPLAVGGMRLWRSMQNS